MTEDPVLQPLLNLIRRIRVVAVAMIGLGMIPPLLELVLGVGAPWPNGTATAYFTTLVIWIILLVVHAHSTGRVAQARFRKRILIFACMGFVCLCIYLFAWAAFVKDQTNTDARIVCGWQVLPAVQKTMERLGLSEEEMLAGSEWKPENVYTKFSLIVARMIVLVSWLTFFAALAALTACYIGLFERVTDRDT